MEQPVTTTYDGSNIVMQTTTSGTTAEPKGGGSGWTWVVIIIVVIIIIVIIAALAAWWSNSSSSSCDKDVCPKPVRKHRLRRGADDTPSDTNGALASQPVALLDLTGNGWVQLDRDIAAILEVYNAERSPDKRVIIKDTQSNIERTKALWEEALKQGHRAFIGASSSNTLAQLKPFINSRPDTVFLSVGSTAPSLAGRDNIYRLVKNDTQMIPAVPQFLARRYDYIHILEDENSIWARELSQLMQDALRAEGITVGVTKVRGPLLSSNGSASSGASTSATTSATTPRTPAANNAITTAESLDDELSNAIPPDANPAFLDIIESNLAQYIFEQIDDAPWSNYKHYGFDTLALFPFTGKAASAAAKTNLETVSYLPEGTLESEAILRRVGRSEVHPLAISAYDAAVSLERVEAELQELERYYNTNRGVTGLLTVNQDGDRITNPYLLWNYNEGNWKANILFGRAIPHGEYVGRFEEPDIDGSSSRSSGRDCYSSRYDESPSYESYDYSSRESYRDSHRDDYHDSYDSGRHDNYGYDSERHDNHSYGYDQNDYSHNDHGYNSHDYGYKSYDQGYSNYGKKECHDQYSHH